MLPTNAFELPEVESLEVKKHELPQDYTPNNYSVLCGRGREFFNAIGNRRFRVIVSIFLERYSQADTKSKKSQIVSDVVDMVRSSGGGFVKLENGGWWEVGDSVAREKVGALFRDCLHEQYKSSGKSKAARRKANLEQLPVMKTQSMFTSLRSPLATANEGFYEA